MKRKIVSLSLIAALTFAIALPVQAETQYGDPNWKVTFTDDRKMESNFKTANLNDKISEMQPGDDVIFTIKLSNEEKNATDWYMTNKVVRSMEDNSVANGGAYTYRLTYKDHNGSVTVIYDSETVGGELEGNTTRAVTGVPEGLHEATNSLEEYFLLDTLEKGQSGQIELRIALDGDTQVNGYQNTLADLTMNFAVELRPSPVNSTREPRERTLVRADTVRTADDSQLILYTVMLLTSGLLLLLISLYCRKVMRKEEE